MTPATTSDARRRRVLILAPVGKDATLVAEALACVGLEPCICPDIAALHREVAAGAACVFLTEEALPHRHAVDRLLDALAGQPPWSDLPVILCYSRSTGSHPAFSRMLTMLEGRVNLTLLERPLGPRLLTASVRSAVRMRRRQYDAERALDELMRAKAEMAELKNAADAANAAKSRFLSHMSHEIRTPLGAILGYSALLQEPHISTREKGDFLDTIKRNGSLLTKLIDEILDLSKVEANGLSLESIPVALPTLVTDLDDLLSGNARDKGIELTFTTGPGVPATILSDPVRLRQILINVVGNAIKFTTEGKVTVTVGAEAREGGPAQLRFDVEDSGVGIAPEHQTKLFAAFSQAESSTTRRFGGTGLGLVLSKRLAQALGGDVVLARSEAGVGSTFRVTIPAREAQGAFSLAKAAAATVGSGAPVPAPRPRRLAGVRVLIVDDAPDNRKLLSHVLRVNGATVGEAADGSEAVERATPGDYDVVLMDLEMPVCDGYDATRSLRDRGYRKPVIAVSANAMKEERERSRRSGCDAHLTKPLDLGMLISTILVHAKEGQGRLGV